MPRPNILVLMSDEHRADLAGFAGNQVIRTPHLDELARGGVVFTNAYTPSPICVPARQCLMSGQLTRTCGCEGAWMDLAPGYPTFARRFAEYAYQAVCSGKLHHLGPDQMQGWTRRLAPDAEVFDKYREGLIRDEYLPFDALRASCGEPVEPPHRPARLAGRKTNGDYVREARPEFGKYQRFDLRATEDAEDFVKGYFAGSAAKRRPLLLQLSLLQPHCPFFTSRELFDYYLPRVPVYDERPCDHPVLSQSQVEEPVTVSPDEIRRATAAYYGMVETVDGYFGRLLGALRAAGQDLDDWLIIFTSDHGEMLGQHGIWEKARFYEASVRVPLVIRWPRRLPAGKTVGENVSLCDLFATLCDLTGVPAYPNLDSRTLVPLMERRACWSGEVVSQIRRRGRDHVMIKRGDLKYQHYGEGLPEVLFDLARDPGENENLAGDGAYRPALEGFRRRLAELGYGPEARSGYVNAGYDPGVPVAEAGTGTLWKPDSNPWLDPL